MSHNKYEVEDFVKNAIWELCDADEIKKSSRLVKDLGLSEEDIVYVADDLQSEFEIDIYEDDMERWVTVRDVIKFVLNSIQEQEW
jgi:acyl carrier protein